MNKLLIKIDLGDSSFIINDNHEICILNVDFTYPNQSKIQLIDYAFKITESAQLNCNNSFLEVSGDNFLNIRNLP